MLANNPEYRRLKVEGYGPLGSASYWLGRDHLLVVVTSNYVENYQRFLYTDIQAIVVRRSPLRMIWGTVLSLVTVGALFGAWAIKSNAAPNGLSQGELFGLGTLLGIALVFAALQTLNLLRGPTCVCHLRTAVQTLALPHLTRWRKADVLIAELAPVTVAAQGGTAAPPAPQGTEATVPSEPPVAEMPNPNGPAMDDPNLPPRISS